MKKLMFSILSFLFYSNLFADTRFFQMDEYVANLKLDAKFIEKNYNKQISQIYTFMAVLKKRANADGGQYGIWERSFTNKKSEHLKMKKNSDGVFSLKVNIPSFNSAEIKDGEDVCLMSSYLIEFTDNTSITLGYFIVPVSEIHKFTEQKAFIDKFLNLTEHDLQINDNTAIRLTYKHES